MAHEFSPYRRAMGPEGLRRTTMYYGPIVGGLPIVAWHCQDCGLLKLDYPDGRKEERRLFPGPQPGLIAVAVAEAVSPEAVSGMQARVSGLSVPARVYRELTVVPAGPRFRLPSVAIPTLAEAVHAVIVLALGFTMLGLVLLGFGAVYDWKTASWVGPLAATVSGVFGGAIVLAIASATARHFLSWPRLKPSLAEELGGRAQLDGVTRALVAVLVAMTAGLSLIGVLAIYDWKTPDIVRPLTFLMVALFVIGTLAAVGGGIARKLASERGPAPPVLDD